MGFQRGGTAIHAVIPAIHAVMAGYRALVAGYLRCAVRSVYAAGARKPAEKLDQGLELLVREALLEERFDAPDVGG